MARNPFYRYVYLIFCAALLAQSLKGVTAQYFEAEALPHLAVEASFDFFRRHTEGLPPRLRDPKTIPRADELEVGAGWTIVLDTAAAQQLQSAAAELEKYLREAMSVTVRVERVSSLLQWRDRERVIIAAARDKLPGTGSALKSAKDYRLVVSNSVVTVCGFDESGAMFGLYNLIMRFRLREAPFLPQNLDTVRHSLYQARITLSGLGWMDWPDRYLATLPLYGFDAIYVGGRNINNTPGPKPYWTDDMKKKHAPGAIKDLLSRTSRFGVGFYAPFIYLFTGTPENIENLRQQVRDTLGAFPDIRGFIILTEGFIYKSWGLTRDEAWIDGWAQGVGLVAEEAHKINPQLEIVPWDYNVRFYPSNAPRKVHVIKALPESVIPMLTFENGKTYKLDGQEGHLLDYAINQIGPAEVTQAQLLAARDRNFRAIYSRADTFASWQFGTFPYLPFPYQWYERYKAMEEWGIQGALESWTYGFKPNWVAEIRAWCSWSDAPPLDDLLRQIARREFGAGAEEDVLAAWRLFSEAIQLYPDTGPNWGSNNAVAAPLFFQEPETPFVTKKHSNGIDYSRKQHPWPYAISRMIFWPDFTNEQDAAQKYIRFFTVPVFQKYLNLSADKMEAGLKLYRRAALAAPEMKRHYAFREVLLAEQLQRMIRSEHAVIDFEQMRLKLAKSQDKTEKIDLLKRMLGLLAEERQRTVSSYEAARRDSRLGYEWEQDYVYTPATLREKIKLIDDTINFQIPEYRQSNGL